MLLAQIQSNNTLPIPYEHGLPDAKLMETGQLTAVIDRSYPLEELAEAHRYVESGAKIGQVVINTKTQR